MAAVLRRAAHLPARRAALLPDGLGQNLVVNGGLDADASWNKGAGWTIGSGVATKSPGTGSNLSQAIGLVAGQAYVATFRVVTRTDGLVRANFLGGTTVVGLPRNAVGTFSEVLIAQPGNTTIALAAASTFAGSCDLVSVHRIP